MKKSEEVIMTEFCCGDCGKDKWKLSVIHHSDGRTLLSFCCADEQCVETKRRLIGADEADMICWDELDITGQGYDRDDIEENNSMLPGLGNN